jgi:hypothetical protein
MRQRRQVKYFLIYFVKFIDNIETMCYLQTTLTKTITLRRKQMIELQIKDLTTNEILAAGTVDELVSMYEDEDEVLEAIESAQTSKQSIKVYGFVGSVYEVSIVCENTVNEIEKTLSADGLSIQQINEYVTDTEEKQYTVFAFHKGQYVTMIVSMSDNEKYIDLVISGHSYFGARIHFLDCSLETTLIDAMNIVKQHTAAN